MTLFRPFLLFSLLLKTVLFPLTVLGEIPVFPGACGFGITTPAGRGGAIIKVTTLEDGGPGSLREAVEAKGARVVVFEVSGTIRLLSELVISNPYLTLAGQTAPAPGITLSGRAFRIATHDVLVQHLRSRPGDGPSGDQSEYEERDALRINDPSKKNSVGNIVIDHCSFSWALDENIGFWGYREKPVENSTISNSIIGESLDNRLLPHSSYGLLVGDFSRNIAIIGNFFISNGERTPLFKGGTSGVVVNNLIYNTGEEARITFADDYDAGPIRAAVIGNVWLDGPAGKTRGPVWFHPNVKKGTEVHLADNLTLGIDGSPYAGSLISSRPAWGSPVVDKRPLWPEGLVARPAGSVSELLLRRAGARPGERCDLHGDPVDCRLVAEVAGRAGALRTSVAEAGGWPDVAVNHLPFVIPDDPHGDPDGNGYTRIEEILHRLAREVEGGD